MEMQVRKEIIMNNKSMNTAKKAKNDEFYTLYETVQNELVHYKEYLRGKVIYCNCDMPSSNFVRFLNDVKEEWGIKDIWHTSIQEGYSFDSDYSIELLKKCDVVITNPPFSLFRSYINLLFEYDKDFLIIGNALQISYKPIFYKIKDNIVNIGISIRKGRTWFSLDGKLKMVNVRWYTNIKPDVEYEPPFLHTDIEEYEYDYFDDTDIINVPSYKLIPEGYKGIMGVPITFIDKLNRKQFEIIGFCSNGYYYGDVPCYPIVDGESIFARLLIRRL